MFGSLGPAVHLEQGACERQELCTGRAAGLPIVHPPLLDSRSMRAASLRVMTAASRTLAWHHIADTYQDAFHKDSFSRRGSGRLPRQNHAEDSTGRWRQIISTDKSGRHGRALNGSRCAHAPPASVRHSIENLDTRLAALAAYMDVPFAVCVKTTCTLGTLLISCAPCPCEEGSCLMDCFLSPRIDGRVDE